MALDAAAITLGQLQLGQSGQEPGGRPPFTIGPVRERRPQVRKGRQTQRGQHQRQLGGIGGNLGRGTHAGELPRGEERVVAVGAGDIDRDHRHVVEVSDEALLQQLEIGKPVRCEKLVELLGELGFAGSVMSQPEETDHDPAGAPLIEGRTQRVPASPVGGTGKELIAIAQPGQGLGLGAQAMDDVVVVSPHGRDRHAHAREGGRVAGSGSGWRRARARGDHRRCAP